MSDHGTGLLLKVANEEIARLRTELAAVQKEKQNAHTWACQIMDNQNAIIKRQEAELDAMRKALMFALIWINVQHPTNQAMIVSRQQVQEKARAALQSHRGLDKAAEWWCGANCSCEGECQSKD